ncbi:HesA/MoeB/ThiF family protein [Desulfolutivibrio sp.]|uniref:HesA/MoeB/ThiF family protein n=1 Tax=Desulfolutivibrio sp. TaxID=2773296 RepID=UPI002F966999
MDLLRAIASRATPGRLPDGTPVRVLSGFHCAVLAREHSLPAREVDARALDAGILPGRYLRNFMAYSPAEQAGLLRSTAALVGLGGLGGTVLEIMARTGVGTIVAADGDRFEESNLNRQLLAEGARLDRPKAEAALARAAAINPTVTVTARAAFLDAAGMAACVAGVQVAVDALGGLVDRPVLAKAAAARGIPLVTAAVAGDTGYVATVLPGGPALWDILGGSADPAENALGCQAAGVTVAAGLQAAEALRLLAGRPPRLAGRLLVVDLSDMTFETVSLT